MEQMKGIEPSKPAWEAGILPLNYICNKNIISRFIRVVNRLNKSFVNLFMCSSIVPAKSQKNSKQIRHLIRQVTEKADDVTTYKYGGHRFR